MTINFGLLPARSSFTLSSDADFYQVVETSDGTNYPVPTVMSLKLYNAADAVVATWSATVSGDTATFLIDKAVVAAALLLFPVSGRVFYHDGTTGPELVLARGNIHDVSP